MKWSEAGKKMISYLPNTKRHFLELLDREDGVILGCLRARRAKLSINIETHSIFAITAFPWPFINRVCLRRHTYTHTYLHAKEANSKSA